MNIASVCPHKFSSENACVCVCVLGSYATCCSTLGVPSSQRDDLLALIPFH